MMGDMADSLALELRLPVEADVPMLEKLTTDPAATGEFASYGYHDTLRWRRGWAENELIGPDGGVFAVVAGDEPVGFVNWRRQRVGPVATFWEIGIALLPEARGRGYGTEAQRLLARYLLAHTPAHRIQATTEAGNLAEQRSLEKAGFSREGVSRGIGWRGGAWRDGVTYSLLRTDPAP
jgi:RimJ/RimL family protein N-acetyltransferase